MHGNPDFGLIAGNRRGRPKVGTIAPARCRKATSPNGKVDARTYEAVTKKGGKNTVTVRIVVAADGKTRVTTQTGRDGQGRTVNNTIFYEKQ